MAFESHLIEDSEIKYERINWSHDDFGGIALCIGKVIPPNDAAPGEGLNL